MDDKFLQPKISPSVLSEMVSLLNQIEQKLHNGEDVSELIGQYNSKTGKETTKFEFATYHESMSKDEFIEETLTLTPTKMSDISDEDMIGLIDAIKKGDYPDERHCDYWIDLLRINIPCSEISDLIFYPEEEGLTSEEILQKAKAKKPIILL